MSTLQQKFRLVFLRVLSGLICAALLVACSEEEKDAQNVSSSQSSISSTSSSAASSVSVSSSSSTASASSSTSSTSSATSSSSSSQSSVAQVPAAPSGLVATAGTSQVILTWSASANATSYSIRRSTTSGASYSSIATTGNTTYTDTTVTNGTTYYYVVVAVNAQGSSSASSQASATPTQPVVVVPDVPAGLVATAWDAQVTLTWTTSARATSYVVKRATSSGGSFVTIATVTATLYADSAVTNGATYYYVVAAVNSSGSSANSAQVNATPVATAATQPPVGQWVDITPPVPQPWANTSAFFFGWTGLDGAKPDAPGTLYAFIDRGQDQYSGVWKSTNSGASWSYLNQGPNGELKSGGFVMVDPTNSNVVYAGVPKQSYGLFKSENGGGSWRQILPANYEHDVYGLSINPHNNLHLLLTFHSCQVNWPLVSGGTTGAACGVLESFDGGSTWIARPAAGWSSGSQFAFFVGKKNDGSADTSGTYWIVSNQQGSGIWRTENSGTSWTQVATFDQTHGMQSLYRAANNALYMGSVGKVFRSLDNGRTWSDTGAQYSGDGYGGIVGDGANIWTMLANTGQAVFGPYKWQTLPENDSTSSATSSHWSTYGTTTYTSGPVRMFYDAVNKVIYSAQWGAGVYKMRVGP